MSESAESIVLMEEAVAARFEAMVRQKLVDMIVKLGPELQGVTRDATWANAWRNTLREYLRINPVVTLAERIATDAYLYGRRHTAAMLAELDRHRASLQDSTLTDRGRLAFTITGTAAGQPARIEFSMALDLNREGRPCHAFKSQVFVADRLASPAFLAKLAA